MFKVSIYPIFLNDFFSSVFLIFHYKYFIVYRMEVTDANLQTLAGYLEQTLSPDAGIRRTGKLITSRVSSNRYKIVQFKLNI